MAGAQQQDIHRAGARHRADRLGMRLPLFAPRKRGSIEPWSSALCGQSLVVKPGPSGPPTVWDRDIVIFLASQPDISGDTVVIDIAALSAFAQRRGGARGRPRLEEALRRLSECRYTGSAVRDRIDPDCGWIAGFRFREDRDAPLRVELRLSNWAVALFTDAGAMAPLDPGHFRLTGGLERRLSELLAERGAADWLVPTRDLALFLGSRQSSMRRLNFEIGAIAARDALPSHHVAVRRTTDDTHLCAYPRRGAVATNTTTQGTH